MDRSIEKAFVSFRIGSPLWLPEARFDTVLALLGKHSGITDELAFFTSDTHPPLPLEVIRGRLGVAVERMRRARMAGYRVGINVLATIGHHNENLAYSLDGGFTRMTAPDGRLCAGSFCPNDESFRRDYIAPLYTMVTQTEPDFIWIDDDVRLLSHMPIPSGCFCDTCLHVFAEESGVHIPRTELWCAFNEGALEDKLLLRRAWLDHNRRTMARLFGLIEKTVHDLRPGLPLGFMTGERFFEGNDFDSWAETLAGSTACDVMWRPGGGFYSDETLDGLVDKAHDIGRQVSGLPESVVCIQSEIENFPYQLLRKAAHTTALEAAAHIAAGCTGAAFNVLTMHDEPPDEYEPLLRKLLRTRPFLDRLVRTLGREQPTGIFTGWNKDTFATCSIDGPDWFGGGVTHAPAREMFQIGLPVAYDLTQAPVTALSGNLPLSFTDDEIETILSGGVYLDGSALMRLHERGYGAHTGFTVERYVDADAIEEFTGHALNGVFAGCRRDARQSFLSWLQPAAVLQPLSDTAQSLSRMVDYGGVETASCCAGVFENALGGRVCVGGYYPWTFLQSLSASTRTKAVFRWLSRDQLDAFVASYHRINLWVRRCPDGKLAVALINSSLDPAEDVELTLRTDATEISVVDMQCVATCVSASRGAGSSARSFQLPTIPAWEMRLIVTR